MLGSSNFSGSQTALTDTNIHAAVDLWVSDQSAAEFTYGHISNWDTSNVTNMFGLFSGVDIDESISNWDVSNVTNMGWMFEDSNFNQPIGNWDVSSVTNMYSMFGNSDFNQPIGNWDVSSVTDMSSMFYFANEFDQPIGDWDVSSVTNMSRMFVGKSFLRQGGPPPYADPSFNQPIGNWDVSSVTTMEEMFYGATVFNHPIGNWDVSNVTNMTGMFRGEWFMYDMDLEYFPTQFNQNIGGWNVSNVTDMSFMFDVSQFSQPIGNWDVGSVTNMARMFRVSSFDQDISNWDVSSVTNMAGMFSGDYDYGGGDDYQPNPFNQNIGSWDVSNVTDMSRMFYYATSFNQPIGNWDVSSVIYMSGMFKGLLNGPEGSGYGSVTSFNQPIGNWDVSNVKNMVGMFAASLFNQDLSDWDVSSVTSMSGMFYNYWHDTSFSTTNYDALLLGWASLGILQPNVAFNAGVSSYCNGETARDYIINTYGWTITDGGLDCSSIVNCLTVEDANAFIEVTNDIGLILENDHIIKGFQFDITFPEGFVFDPNDIANTGLPQDFQVSCANVGGNSYRVIGFSLSNETIVSGTASILTFPTFINEEVLEGDYPIPVTGLILSDVNNEDVASLCSTDGIITVYSHPMGDANGDDTVNILDILGTIDYIFGNPPSTFYFDLADVNFDTTINVLDVLGIQDIILSPAGRAFNNDINTSTADDLVGDNYLMVTHDVFTPNTSETIEINLVNEAIGKGLQFDFVLPEGFTLNPADIIGTSRLDGFNISAQEVSTNTYRVIVFSLTSATVAHGTGAVLNVPVFIESDVSSAVYPIAYTEVVISDTNNTDVSTTPPSVGEITIGTLGIGNLENYEDHVKLYPNPVQNSRSIYAEC